MSVRRGFTMIELIFSLVIIAVIATISTDVIRLVFERYVISRDLERGQSDVRRTLDLLAARLQHRIKNSAVGRSEAGEIEPIGNDVRSGQHEILEWVGIAYESRRGINNKTGWNGFLQVVPTPDNEHNLSSPGSNFAVAKAIESALTNDGEPFINRKTVLVFAGSDYRGAHSDAEYGDVTSWGWLASHKKSSYFQVTPKNENETDFNLIAFENADYAPPSQEYFLARSAYALWVEDGNLMLAYNYRPWNNEYYNDHNTSKQTLLENVASFQFRENGGVLRLILCVTAPESVAGKNVEFCRERSVL